MHSQHLRRLLSAALIVASAIACSDRSPVQPRATNGDDAQLNVGPVADADLSIASATVYPGYRLATNPTCSGHDAAFLQIPALTRRSWVSRASGIATVSPVVTYNDSGSTAIVTGGTSVGATRIVCTIHGINGSTASDSATINNPGTPDISVISTGKPVSIPIGGTGIFTFTVSSLGQTQNGGSLDYLVTGGSIVSRTARSVTVQATGAAGTSLSVVASITLIDSNVRNASDQPLTLNGTGSASTPIVASVSVTGPTYRYNQNATFTASVNPSGSYYYVWKYKPCFMSTNPMPGDCDETTYTWASGQNLTSKTMYISSHIREVEIYVLVYNQQGGTLIGSGVHVIRGAGETGDGTECPGGMCRVSRTLPP